MQESAGRTDARTRSSRLSAEDAGWEPEHQQWTYGSWEIRLRQLKNRRWRDFSWLTARALLDSANDKIAKSIHDLVNPQRERWMAAQRAAGAFTDCPDLVMDRPHWKSCLLLGDTGEADGSQYAVVAPMLSVHKQHGSDFMVILSDVIYPAGDVNQYVNGFNGFMVHFCGAEALPPTAFRRTSYSAPERIANVLWRRADRPDRTLLRHHATERRATGVPAQPAPYWAIDMAGIRLVAIDTGIKGTLDREARHPQ